MHRTRREFLKHGAFAGAIAAFSGQLFAQSDPSVTAAASVVTDGIYTFPMRHIVAKPASTPRVISIPDVEGFRVLKGDFHLHTLFSDGEVMPKQRVTEALDNGLDVIAMTDHIEYRPNFGGPKGRFQLKERNDDYNLSFELAKPEADKRGLLLILGTEITKSTMPPGHFNALFLKDANPVAAAVEDWRTMLKVAADQGAFLQWNHPGWAAPKSGGIEKGAPLVFTPEHEEALEKGLLHGIEVFNDTEFYPAALSWCRDKNLAYIANSDIHPSEFDKYGVQNPMRPMTLVLAKDKTLESVREAFFAKRTIGWAGGMLFGSKKWLSALFKACVVNGTNKSDLPIQITKSDTGITTVPNWLTGAGEPLVI